MTDSNEEKRLSARIYQPLPNIEDKQPLPITAEVDQLLAAVMAKAGVTEADFEAYVGQFERTDEPVRFLRRKRIFLGALLRKGASGEENRKKEKWEETCKDLLQAWFPPLMHVAVYEPDPSFNRQFIEPALLAFGYRQVQEAILAYLEEGTNQEKAGAARACYWAWLPLIFDDPKTQHEDFQRLQNELAEVRSRRDILLLKTFVEGEDLDVQRSIIPGLSLAPSSYPPQWQRLIPQAIHLARTHPDDYIRHRIEIQIGASRSRSGMSAHFWRTPFP